MNLSVSVIARKVTVTGTVGANWPAKTGNRKDSDTLTGVPILMDIPIIGALFRRTTKVKERRTLYIFLTPYILYDHSFGDFRELTEKRKMDIENLRGSTLDHLNVSAREKGLPKSTFRFHNPKSKKAGGVK